MPPSPRIQRRLALLALLLPLAACATTTPHKQPPVHALPAGTTLDFAALATTMAQADVILIGEEHDNRAHHSNQGLLIGAIAEHAGQVRIVMEMLDLDSQGIKPRVSATDTRAWRALRRALAWDKSGWPAWKYYQPVFEAARVAKAPIYAGLPPKAVVKAAMPLNSTAPTQGYFELEDLVAPMPATAEEKLRTDLQVSHCNMLQGESLARMVRGQRARDAGMARTILALLDEPGSRGPVILIAGNGHVREDFGVPWHLNRLRSPDQRPLQIVSLGQQSIRREATESGPADIGAFDYTITDGTVDRPDPCAGLAKHFKAKKAP